MKANIKDHWEKIYRTHSANQVSWTQPVPTTSLNFIHSFNLTKTAKIIDIGGGDSRLVDYLIAQGYEDITVLDISETAIEKVKRRLGIKANRVKWIVTDVASFKPKEKYDLWHDRATFHFLTTESQVSTYVSIAQQSVSKYLVIGTFSENGPEKCSGLAIKQYSEQQLQGELSKGFEKIKCIKEDHITPFATRQNFLFCSFRALH